MIHTQTDDEENDCVQGTAHVIVTSRANGKSVSGDTNENGSNAGGKWGEFPRKSVSEQ